MTNSEGKTLTFKIQDDAQRELEIKKLVRAEKAQAKAAKEAAQTREEALKANVENFTRYNAEDFACLSEAPRRRARELSLLIFFQVAIGASAWETAENVLAAAGINQENGDFAITLAKNAYEQRENTDKLLSQYAREWDVERFSQIDRAVLHLAVPELLQEPENGNIIINEAIELGKRFGTSESGPFINGILDSILNKHIAEESDKAAIKEEKE